MKKFINSKILFSLIIVVFLISSFKIVKAEVGILTTTKLTSTEVILSMQFNVEDIGKDAQVTLSSDINQGPIYKKTSDFKINNKVHTVSFLGLSPDVKYISYVVRDSFSVGVPFRFTTPKEEILPPQPTTFTCSKLVESDVVKFTVEISAGDIKKYEVGVIPAAATDNLTMHWGLLAVPLSNTKGTFSINRNFITKLIPYKVKIQEIDNHMNVYDLNDCLFTITNNDPATTTPPPTGGNPTTDLSSKGSALVPDCPARGCGFKELIMLVNKVIDFLLFKIASSIAVLVFAYCGFLLLTASGDPGKLTTVKTIIKNLLLGYVIALAAWLIINSILGALLGTGIETFLVQ